MAKYFLPAYLFGLAAGVLCIVAFLLMFYMGNEPVSMVLIFGYIISPLFIFLGIKHFREVYNQGNLYFGQGMTVGFFVYSIMAMVSAVFIFLFLNFNPETFETFRAMNLALLDEKKEVLIAQLSQESFDDTYESITGMTKFDVASNDFLRKIFPGLFFTIIISIILKRTIK
jgi:hypothetical protein